MPDIALCSNSQCPLRDNCYRYRAIPSKYNQVYTKFRPFRNEECDAFWDAREYAPTRLRTVDEVDWEWEGMEHG